MPNAVIKGCSYCLSHTPNLAYYYGNTPWVEKIGNPESEFLGKLKNHMQTYEEAASYPANLTFTGAMDLDELSKRATPWSANRNAEPVRNGKYGEIMPEDEFLGVMDIVDVFDLIWLEEGFAAKIREKLSNHPLFSSDDLAKLEKGHPLTEIKEATEHHKALPLWIGGDIVGCVREGHQIDECLSAYVLLENIASKAGGVIALRQLLKNTGMKAEDVDFIVECSEEAAGDMNQRGGGNFAKAIAESSGCFNASGFDIRAFCAGPVNAVVAAAGMAASGSRKNVVVVAGGAVPKLYMNSRDHVKKSMPALEDCLGAFAILIEPDDGVSPVMRLDSIGKHTVKAGASPQAITSALVFEPLQKLGLSFNDVDKYAAQHHIPEITVPAGAGDVPTSQFKMIAALAAMKGAIEKSAMNDFVKEKGMPGFAHTQGHIPSGVPFIGHACDAIKEGKMKRAMIIGKGSLFLARLTNLSDGVSFILEANDGSGVAAGGTIDKEQVKAMVLEALSELASKL